MAGRIASLIGRMVLPRRRRHSFVRDERAVTAVEFGLLAVPFFAILGAILETSVVFLSGQVLDTAVHDVGRLVRTGQVQAANMNAVAFKKQLCDRLYGLFNECNDPDRGLHVELQILNSFTAATVRPPVDWDCKKDCGWTRTEIYEPGQGSSIVLMQVYFKWPLILNMPMLGLANLGDGRRVMGSATVFRNEPFPS